MVQVTINERIKDIRTESKMNLQEFGELLGLPSSTCSDYEKDFAVVPSDIIIKICEKCNVSSDYLLGITNTRQIENSRIFCTRWVGIDKGSIFDDVKDDKEFEGNLIFLKKSAEDFVKNNSRVRFQKKPHID